MYNDCQFYGIADFLYILKNHHPDLSGCEGTIKFCRSVKALINATNIRTPINNLKPDNAMWQSTEEFIKYLEKWGCEATQKGYDFITASTCYGLKVSLKYALQICRYLIESCGFKYLMKSRLNQDSLEILGMMRYCCGLNDHPESALFVQMYKFDNKTTKKERHCTKWEKTEVMSERELAESGSPSKELIESSRLAPYTSLFFSCGSAKTKRIELIQIMLALYTQITDQLLM
ncbi:uncharacterized protein LOC111643559 [Copidosoma floridanum]|uniref:uncharacterized protein LOC111643559 n=1 Tax=Copidosoma floridanum TaxID=29053 RepID=UPI000C6F65D8|nr:uncharacterized protein LOC111643559 [Copidosoma floridanum]